MTPRSSRASSTQIDTLYGHTVSTISDDFLYLSDMHTAIDMDILYVLNITHIINASNNAVPNKFPDTIDYININIDDNEDENISEHFDIVYDKLSETPIEEKRILFHCMLGISRSATLLIAFLMKSQNLTLKEAFETVKHKRPKIQPNYNFAQALLKYEKELRPNDDNTLTLYALTGLRSRPSTKTSIIKNPITTLTPVIQGANEDSVAMSSTRTQSEENKSTCCCVIS
jgi:hypothetical protein